MAFKFSGINLLDDNAWRRDCFVAGLVTAFAGDPVRVRAHESSGSLRTIAENELCLVVLGGACLSSQHGLARMHEARQAFPGGVAILADHITAECISVALQNRLCAVLSTAESGEMIQATLRFVLSGGTYYPHAQTLPAPSGDLAGYLPPPARGDATTDGSEAEADTVSDEVIAGLTRRQRDVAVALAIGASNKEIARELNLSEATVKSHVRQIMRKFDATNRTQVALRAQMVVRQAQPQIEHQLVHG
ncbi:MAG: response regulator transcription factor [Pseudooceanicola sp.]